LERITSLPYICNMINNNTFGSGNGVANTTSSSVSSSVPTKKSNKITLAKFVKRLNVTPMTAKGFNKRAITMGKAITYIVTNKFQYAVDGNRVTAKDASDFVSDAMLTILNGSQVDMVNFTYNGEPMTQGKFFSLWLKASFQQCQRNDQFGRITRKCKVTGKRVTINKIAVGGIATTNSDGVEAIAPNVENALLSKAPEGMFELDLAKAIQVQFNMAESNSDKRFWTTFGRMVEVETSNLPTESVCVFYGWENRNAYYVAKKRLLEDSRLDAIRKLRNL
jgi:hypothetical protein